MSKFVLALDQGTTSSRSIVFGRDGRAVASAQQEFPQIYPQPGHVEHDPEAIWTTQLQTAKDALAKARLTASDIAAIGVTNQRETTVLWDRTTGRPVANAIVWQSRITADICAKLKADGTETVFRKKTGLVVDAYFSGTKIKHLLDTVSGQREVRAAGDVKQRDPNVTSLPARRPVPLWPSRGVQPSHSARCWLSSTRQMPSSSRPGTQGSMMR